MPIEITDEMRAAFLANTDDTCEQAGCSRDDCLDVRLAAAFAIVERDLLSKCGATVETRGHIVRCAKEPDGHDAHLGRLLGWDVVW